MDYIATATILVNFGKKYYGPLGPKFEFKQIEAGICPPWETKQNEEFKDGANEKCAKKVCKIVQ